MARKKSQTDVPLDQPVEIVQEATTSPGEPSADTNGTVATESQPPLETARSDESNGSNGKKKPAFKVGPLATGKGETVGGCVWENEYTLNGTTYVIHSIVLEISYFNEKEGRWLSSRGIRPSQLSAVAYVLRKCGDFAFQRRDPQADVPF